MSPPPPEYIRLDHARALWTNLGWKADERGVLEEEEALTFLAQEAHVRKLKQK